eukprot:scaffold279876_cov24-Tisochrysis_lutea.AAC.2
MNWALNAIVNCKLNVYLQPSSPFHSTHQSDPAGIWQPASHPCAWLGWAGQRANNTAWPAPGCGPLPRASAACRAVCCVAPP